LSSCALSSLKGRDWSCFKNIVSRTAFSGVDAAFSAGAAAVCAMAAELKVRMVASIAPASSDLFPRPIALLLF
jgi:hypothetical protein